MRKIIVVISILVTIGFSITPEWLRGKWKVFEDGGRDYSRITITEDSFYTHGNLEKEFYKVLKSSKEGDHVYILDIEGLIPHYFMVDHNDKINLYVLYNKRVYMYYLEIDKD